jgi:riboflavin transporter FmnP
LCRTLRAFYYKNSYYNKFITNVSERIVLVIKLNQAKELGIPGARSKTQTLAGISLFAALAIVLNLTHIQVTAPYAYFLTYEFWEIPTVVCLLIFGLYAALAASVVNTVVLLFVNPGAAAFGPIYNLIAVIVMLLAIVAGSRLSTLARFKFPVQIAIATGLGILLRTAVMTVVNYAWLPYPAPLGIQMPESAVVPILPAIAFFNATLALYTVPIGYLGARAVINRVRFKTAYQLEPSSTSKLNN